MKISVLGNIIDTESIYQITPIVLSDFNCGHEDDNGYYFKVDEIEKACKVNFVIYLFNEKTLEISLRLVEYGKIINKEEQIKKITTLRDTVISYWSNNQSQIPKIEFV